jgi:transcription factor MBP1
VYEYNVGGNHVMRRRSDDWINATHILKVADYDKPARTRILEREVQKGVHEKVQGGYGKYQGMFVRRMRGEKMADCECARDVDPFA